MLLMNIYIPLFTARGIFGQIFEPWINPSKCASWGWTDLDVVFGDISGFIKGNPLVHATDIYTVAAMDWTGLYTRGQLTIHNQRRRPKAVNSAWRQCGYSKERRQRERGGERM